MVSGLTGYYQLNKDYRALEDYMQFVLEGTRLDKQYYDMIYQKSCFGLIMEDLAIIFRSIAAVLRAKGI